MATESAAVSESPSIVTIENKKYEVKREGLADLLIPHVEGTPVKKTRAGGDEQSVFYNPIQQFNRDLSVLAVKVIAEDIVAAKKARRSVTRPKAAKQSNSAKRKRDDLPSSAEAAHEAKKPKTGEDKNNLSPDSVEPASGPRSAGEDTASASREEEQDLSKESNAAAHKGHANTAFRILDALSASGLRALRYAKEVPETSLITANDLEAEAVQYIRRNVEFNGVKDKVHPLQGNANSHMYWIGNEISPTMPDGSKGKYDVIDLDPYGTAATFIDSAVQAISDGGMLSITCTDSGVFAAVGYLEKAFALYGGLPLKGSHSHEVGLRLLIHSVATAAAKRGLAIEPLLSLSIDYYIRCFIRVRKSPQEVKLLPGKTMTVYNCDSGCGAWSKQFTARTQTRQNKNRETFYHFTLGQGPTAAPHCEHCGLKTHIAGPMWGGPIHSPFFVQRMLDKLPQLDDETYGTKTRLEGMLTLALNETLLPPEAVKKMQSEATESKHESTNENGQTGIPSPEREYVYKPLERLDPAVPDLHPFFTTTADLSRVLHCVVPPDASLRGALKGLGYRVTNSHTKPGSIRTDAPWSVVWDVMRSYVRRKAPTKEGAVKEGTAAWGLWQRDGAGSRKRMEGSLREYLKDEGSVKAAMGMIDELRKSKTSKAPDSEANITEKSSASLDTAISADGGEREIVFDEKLGVDHDRAKLVRYQVNPRKNWGPQSRAK